MTPGISRGHEAKTSGLLFKCISAPRARDADLALAARHAHDLLAARAAEKGVVLPLAEAAPEQPERAGKAVPAGEVFPVFLTSAGKIPGKHAYIAPNQQRQRARRKDHGKKGALRAQRKSEQYARARGDGEKPPERIGAVTTLEKR